MKKIIVTVAALLVSGVAFAQVGTTIKEGAKATGEKGAEVGQTVAGAVTPEPKSTVHKVKAKVHKAKAHAHAAAAKDAASNIGK